MYNDITVSPFLQTKEELFINRQFITDKGETVFITSHDLGLNYFQFQFHRKFHLPNYKLNSQQRFLFYYNRLMIDFVQRQS
jgi:hypothetical protein